MDNRGRRLVKAAEKCFIGCPVSTCVKVTCKLYEKGLAVKLLGNV